MPTERPGSFPAAGIILMLLVVVWSGALAAGFFFAAATGSDEMGVGRTLAFYLIAGFLALLAGRTGYELARRLSHR